MMLAAAMHTDHRALVCDLARRRRLGRPAGWRRGIAVGLAALLCAIAWTAWHGPLAGRLHRWTPRG